MLVELFALALHPAVGVRMSIASAHPHHVSVSSSPLTWVILGYCAQ